MNLRKDIYERVKYIMKEQSEMKVNCSELARQLNCDRRTIRRYVELAKNGEQPSKRVYQKKTDGFEHIIEEKVKTTAPAIAIYHYLVKEHGYTGSYSTLKRYIHNLNIEWQKDAVIRFETNPGMQAQVDWKESGSSEKRVKISALAAAVFLQRRNSHCHSLSKSSFVRIMALLLSPATPAY